MSKILVCEDDESLGDAIVRTLRKAGHEASLGRPGRAVLDQVRQERFDIIVTDVFMPGADGIEVIKAVRAAASPARIIAISGGGEHVPAAVSLMVTEAFGADRILYKPFKNEELLAAIHELSRTAQ